MYFPITLLRPTTPCNNWNQLVLIIIRVSGKRRIWQLAVRRRDCCSISLGTVSAARDYSQAGNSPRSQSIKTTSSFSDCELAGERLKFTAV